MSLDQFVSQGNDASANRDGGGIVYYAEDDIRHIRSADQRIRACKLYLL
jgi:predicted glutamine amidotransferase